MIVQQFDDESDDELEYMPLSHPFMSGAESEQPVALSVNLIQAAGVRIDSPPFVWLLFACLLVVFCFVVA
jgi:hypothetical protein